MGYVIACPKCGSSTRSQYGGERGEAGPYAVCMECGWSDEPDAVNTSKGGGAFKDGYYWWCRGTEKEIFLFAGGEWTGCGSGIIHSTEQLVKSGWRPYARATFPAQPGEAFLVQP